MRHHKKKIQSLMTFFWSLVPLVARKKRLTFFHRIEERGSGFGRMRDEMLNHGLERPVLGTREGYSEVIFYGPGDDLERLSAITSHLFARLLVPNETPLAILSQQLGVNNNGPYVS